MKVIGTAGHVDHGKSTLVAALTGAHPDRLKEEQQREMTIDLGFAWMTLPGGEPVGIVDVPGHRDFIENMLAGVGGIDAVLFIVAADEGVMPQTREHLAILDLLQVKSGIIVMTKADLVDDPEWFSLVEADIRQITVNTALENAPLARVSARTRQGIPELINLIGEVLAGTADRPDLGRPRLPVDRVFTMAGFGTVVTGTLLDGQFATGDEVEILPGGARGRIRGLQTHKQKEQAAFPGSRTAINLSGIDLDQVQRGAVIVHPGQYQTTRRVDVHFRHLPDSGGPLKHSSEVKLFLHSSEVLARVRLLGSEELAPGEAGWLQLELRQPVTAVRGDRYILRRPSPGETLGGGVIVDPRPDQRHKRFDAGVLAQLQSLLEGAPDEVFLQASLAAGPAPLKEVIARSHLAGETAAKAIQTLRESGQIIFLEEDHDDGLMMAQPTWVTSVEHLQQILQAYHQSYPLRNGMPKEELKSRLKMGTRLFNAFYQKAVEGRLVEEQPGLVKSPGHRVILTKAQQSLVDEWMAKFAASPYSPPSVKEAQAGLGNELYNALVEGGRLVPVSEEVVFRSEDYAGLVDAVHRRLKAQPSLTVAEFRDLFSTSRKYALAFLEHLDAAGVTVREGDNRRLKQH